MKRKIQFSLVYRDMFQSRGNSSPVRTNWSASRLL